MKKVIFVCLLSLSVCLSAPNQPQETAPASAPPSAAPVATGTDANAAPKPEHPVATTNGTAPKPAATVPAQNTPATNSTQPAPASNDTSSKTTTNETKPSEKSNTTDAKPNTDPAVKPTEKVPEPAKDKTENKTVVPVAPTNNGTNADSKDGKKNETTTTPKADNVSPTVAPTVQTKTRAFDGPSFIGGIILTLGLLAIGFMGFKYYKNQTERNYHTL
ncbi:proteoglycan 4-like [Spodoptera litura]|uniref:Proteoglycan 4-like n=1 Tax=Spodoptera litura TaxID=69820 RepID=A0A9J7EBV9_SPOLT|nr:proteoglycan 4-like [Spodoptera litura]